MSHKPLRNPLGPFQPAWDAWEGAYEDIKKLPIDHFVTTYLVQLLEIREALAVDNKAHAAEEIFDIISVSFNFFRWLGLAPPEIAKLAQKRVATRYIGQTKAILQKYHQKYGA